jgi:hypothetical protein
MGQYELRFLDAADAVLFARAHLAADDLAALQAATLQSGNHTVEVWGNSRRVARVKKGNAPIDPQDRVCG